MAVECAKSFLQLREEEDRSRRHLQSILEDLEKQTQTPDVKSKIEKVKKALAIDRSAWSNPDLTREAQAVADYGRGGPGSSQGAKEMKEDPDQEKMIHIHGLTPLSGVPIDLPLHLPPKRKMSCDVRPYGAPSSDEDMEKDAETRQIMQMEAKSESSKSGVQALRDTIFTWREGQRQKVAQYCKAERGDVSDMIKKMIDVGISNVSCTVETVRNIIKHVKKDDELSFRDVYGRTLLHWLCEEHKGEMYEEKYINILLMRGLNINAQDQHGKTPLAVAVEHNRHGIARQLIEAGADCNIADDLERTPLHLSRSKGKAATAALLIKHGGDITKVDCNQRTPVHAAILNKAKSTLCDLIQSVGYARDAILNYRDNNGFTYLHFAVVQSQLWAVKILCQKGVDVNVQDYNKFTALHIAVVREDVEMVTTLIGARVNVNLRDRFDKTPLHLACMKSNLSIISALLDAGATPNVADFNGRVAIMEICRSSVTKDTQATIQTLLNYGGRVNVSDKDYRSPLHFACKMGKDVDVIKCLVDAGSDITAPDNSNRTPLDMAVSYQHSLGREGFTYQRVVQFLKGNMLKI